MQAGLAILCNADSVFISELITNHECGRTYEADNPASLSVVVHSFIDHPENLQQMKRNAHEFTRSEFNWEVQSAPYMEAIQSLYHQRDQRV